MSTRRCIFVEVNQEQGAGGTGAPCMNTAVCVNECLLYFHFDFDLNFEYWCIQKSSSSRLGNEMVTSPTSCASLASLETIMRS